jgi:hypothetical protein
MGYPVFVLFIYLSVFYNAPIADMLPLSSDGLPENLDADLDMDLFNPSLVNYHIGYYRISYYTMFQKPRLWSMYDLYVNNYNTLLSDTASLSLDTSTNDVTGLLPGNSIPCNLSLNLLEFSWDLPEYQNFNKFPQYSAANESLLPKFLNSVGSVESSIDSPHPNSDSGESILAELPERKNLL